MSDIKGLFAVHRALPPSFLLLRPSVRRVSARPSVFLPDDLSSRRSGCQFPFQIKTPASQEPRTDPKSAVTERASEAAAKSPATRSPHARCGSKMRTFLDRPFASFECGSGAECQNPLLPRQATGTDSGGGRAFLARRIGLRAGVIVTDGIYRVAINPTPPLTKHE